MVICPLPCFENLTTEALPEILACGEPAAPSEAATGPGLTAPTHHRAKADRKGGVNAKKF